MLTGKAVRGCGSRTAGSSYLCTGMSVFGQAIENFILDPVIAWEWEWQRGYKLIKRKDGYNDVVIFVGEQFYKSLWDYVEETRRFGASRKVASNFPFDKITPFKSKLLFAHRKVIPKFQYYLNRTCPLKDCKYFKDDYEVWYEFRTSNHKMVTGWHPTFESKDVYSSPCTFGHRDLSCYLSDNVEWLKDGTEFIIKMASFQYEGFTPPACTVPDIRDLKKDEYWQIGIFMSLPITHIEIPLKDNPDVREKANKAGFDVEITEW